MSSRTRLILGAIILVAVIAGVLGLDQLQRRSATSAPQQAAITLAAGSVPIYKDGILVAGFSPADLERLEKTSFIEPVDGVSQDGWLLREVLLLYISGDQLTPEQVVTVSSSSRNKSMQLTWAEVDQRENMVMFDLSNRGTLKLVSLLGKLNTRDEWVQDVDKIEVARP
jgi:hypothetical protein